jgi:alkylation response protein AidB-like acyl-CoA dehydrogenase
MFRARARSWLAANMPPAPGPDYIVEQRRSDGTRARHLQRLLYDGGFAGICFPKAYGGQGLTWEHQRAFSEESVAYEMPLLFNVATLTIVAPTILEFGTDSQKERYISAILRGDELWVQLLSEPGGGSNLAGVVTSANADGDDFVLEGSKVWTSGAYWADYGLCLARTDWSARKHKGLTMFFVKLDQPGVEIRRIRMINGDTEFCEEFLTHVHVSSGDVLGDINGGWTVTSRLLVNERDAVGGTSIYASGLLPRSAQAADDLVNLARELGVEHDGQVRQRLVDARVRQIVQQQLVDRIMLGMRTGRLPATGGALGRLFAADNAERCADLALELAGKVAAAWNPGDPGETAADWFLMRQATSLGGGSSEMQRNIISERLLGMPREPAPDHTGPFNQVRLSLGQTPGGGEAKPNAQRR